MWNGEICRRCSDLLRIGAAPLDRRSAKNAANGQPVAADRGLRHPASVVTAMVPVPTGTVGGPADVVAADVLVISATVFVGTTPRPAIVVAGMPDAADLAASAACVAAPAAAVITIVATATTSTTIGKTSTTIEFSIAAFVFTGVAIVFTLVVTVGTVVQTATSGGPSVVPAVGRGGGKSHARKGKQGARQPFLHSRSYLSVRPSS